jgi:uncharacterized protein (TIGR03084 family)
VIANLLEDLRVESEELDGLVAPLPDDTWRRETPASGWTVAHQIAHLAWTDRVALLAITDAMAFAAELTQASAGLLDQAAGEGAALPPAELLTRWRKGRDELSAALAAVSEGEKLQWFGPPMSAASMATARIMETWAHGQDVADSLGVQRVPTARLKHVAHIGVRTFGFAFALHGLAVPEEPVRVELTGPGRQEWAWGPPDAENRVSGPAVDFCLLVTQRRNRRDLALNACGEVVERWLPIAQAFAGPPGAGRSARS